MSVTQFISRVERPYGANAFTENVPGPGSYNDLSAKPSLPGFAPFSGSSKRMNGSDSAKNIPAPGTYDLERSIVPPSSSTASAFKSKAKRFEDVPESAIVPGPGEEHSNRNILTEYKKYPVRI